MVINQCVPRDKCTDPAKWGQEIGACLSKVKQVDPLKGADLFAAIVDPGLMEIEIARTGRLDEAMDRTIKRIMHLKAAKQVFPNMRKHAKSEPKLISAPESAAPQPALVFEKQLKPSQAVMPAEQEAKNSAEGGVVIEGSCIDEGGPRPVTSTPIANEPPALFAANESKPANLTEVVISAKPDEEGTEFTAEAVVVPEESYINEVEPAPVSPTPIANEPPALFAANELKPATLTEAVIPAKPEVGDREFAAEADLALEGSHIGEGGPASLASTPIAVEQPAMVAENQLKPTSPSERVISAKPEVPTFTTKAGVVLQGSPIEVGVPAPVSPTLSEKVRFGLLLGIDEIVAEQPRASLEELQAFSAFCNEMFRSNASNTGGS
jgi:hypothetical protein